MGHHAAASRASGKEATSSIKANAPIRNRRFGQHIVVALIGAMAAYLFWLSRMEWDAEMRTWRAIGDAAFILLFVAMTIGPVARIWPRRLSFLVNWRRAFGIWFAIFASVHAFLVWDGWARWSIRGFFGYQELPVVGLSGPVLVDPGFGLANMVGLVALFFGLFLFAISSDKAMRFLGSSTWKHLQNYAYVVFYLVSLHGIYFLFLHYEPSLRNLFFQRGVPDPNWFRFWFIGLVGTVFLLQSTALVKVVLQRRRKGGSAHDGQNQ
ncbi:ferric reductase-like transmembrane domain-containing protein [Halomonas sp. ANAO-440]|uniref:ferric reductase-like transmembrane domain-containing protein n=1 Tax=Halomonas sp. ANAO-440 TaxID=2861360 RepID=UPI001CAA474D|nr:ferric reductase-like transmembrane domain-containing protein [Halomonas sp. ANAO-440]MBZ0329301.1 ferric reductase-like transmembrane domain-containing protein [Halomonas sp. ANAO-440]